jgi:endonuclease/exonuclease/phosphatase family metal-dependent hydrolase
MSLLHRVWQFGCVTGLLALALPRPADAVETISVLTWNVAGNGVADWSTNAAQVQAIGRHLTSLQPDIVTFQEIPLTNTWQMPNWVRAFLPGYVLATNSGTDGYIRSVIASRYPITRSTKWLDGVLLTPFGDTNRFTRDLFEAQIAVPGFNLPLHVFTTHLKSSTDSASVIRRAAEASAISNYFVTGFLTTNAARPYLLTGDLNEDILRPPAGSRQPIQRLTNAPTGLRLTTPRNATNDDRTFSARSSFTRRYDYLLPGGLLYSNLVTNLVFRSDTTTPLPAGWTAGETGVASDHTPVLAVFKNPFNTPFRLLSVSVSNSVASLRWEAAAGRQYRVESSSNLVAWTSLATNLVATGSVFTFRTNLGAAASYFRIYRVP